MMEMQMKNHSIGIDLQLSPIPLIIKGNQYRLEQVLVNLLSNAKYALQEKKNLLNDNGYKMNISIKSFLKNNNVVIEVTDNGTGIENGVISKIFNPFFTTKSGKEGTGLGLSISYGIIQEMKGNIEVKSEKGKYTTFVIELPKV
jgi:C4-dicarboxylate-specific signal transduction histidine kinase